MALTSISYSTNPKKNWEFWVILEFFWKFTGFGFSTGLTPGETLCHRSSVLQKLNIFGFFMQSYTCLLMDLSFHGVLGLQKVKIQPNFDFLPLFWAAEVVLGELTFDYANDLQIKKFQLGWKVDSETFPTSYPKPHSDTGKASKQGSKVRDPLSWMCAIRWGNFARFDQFSPEFAV